MRRRENLALLAVIVLVALNLRPAVTSVGPLLDVLQRSLGVSDRWAGVLTAIPVVCFAAGGYAAVPVMRRFGHRYAIALGLGMVGIGLAVRVLAGPALLFAGTVVTAVGIVLLAVLLPVLLTTFPGAGGLLTGSLQAGAALGAAATPYAVAAFGGWRIPLGIWAVLPFLALIAWLMLPQGQKSAPERRIRLVNRPYVWVLAIFFGAQALVAFAVIGWLPQVLLSAGVGREQSGLLLALLAVIAVPVSFLLALTSHRRGWIVGLTGCTAAGVLGLLVAPAAAPLLWTMLIGVGLSVFSLALLIIPLRATGQSEAAALSAVVQSVGYLIASLGPFLVGTLRESTGDWSVPLGLLLGALVVQLITGVTAAATSPRSRPARRDCGSGS